MATPKRRLDVLLVERGLVASRERARAVILAGQVRVEGQVVSKAGTPVAEAAHVELATPDHPYVGRGGLKLAHALDTFGIDVKGRRGLDIGASTGGFTDVMLQRGATDVIALDVPAPYHLRTALLHTPRFYRSVAARLRPVLEEGDPEPLLRAYAADTQTDLVVTGARGQSGALDLILGNTARRLIEGLSCDVLAVRAAA